MKHHAAYPSQATAFTLIGTLSLLGLVQPEPSFAQTKPTKAEARVAAKVEKARRAGERAEKEASEGLRSFQRKVAEYGRLHTAQLARLGTLEPAKIEEALARAIVSKRDDAERGDLFGRDVQPLFRRLIAEQLKGPDTAPAQEAVLDGNPTRDEDSVPVVVRVNAAYPSGASRSTIPPSLLLALPPLPACLQYRFVGTDLLLVDAVAQIIVDFLPAAAPALGAR